MIYLDYAATSPILPEVKRAILDAMENFPGNASALHAPGHRAHKLIEQARAEVARLINADPSEIIFTSGGSESNNTVINTFAGQLVAVSATEHASVLDSARAHCPCLIIPVDKHGEIKKGDLFEVFEAHLSPSEAATSIPDGTGRFVSVGDGSVGCPAYDVPVEEGCAEKTLNKSPSLISIMLANNELGTVQDIKRLAELAHQHGALFHTDATQALGKILINVKDLGVDYMTISAHKIGGPVGVGALYIKNDAPFKPLIIGGHQEHSRRAGTYATANIAGFGAAAKYTYKHNTPKLYATQIAPLRDHLARRILKEIPFSSNNTSPHSLPNILNISFQAAEGESIQLYLDAHDIAISTGSACASGDGHPSHVLMATTGDAEVAHSSIRFSLGLDTTKNDINQIMQVLPDIINKLQQISTVQTKGAK